MNGELRTFLADCATLAGKKNRDYHPDGIAYLEILRTACDTGMTVEQDLWGKIAKQMSALRKYVIDGRVESEPQRSRMMDIANYMAILSVWDVYKWAIVTDAILFVELKQTCAFPDQSLGCFSRQPDVCDRCRFLAWLKDLLRKIGSPV